MGGFFRPSFVEAARTRPRASGSCVRQVQQKRLGGSVIGGLKNVLGMGCRGRRLAPSPLWTEGGEAGEAQPPPPSGGVCEGGGFEVFAEQFHVEVAVLVDPLLVDHHREGANQPQAAGLVGEDAHQERAAFDLLVEPLDQVGRLEVLVMRAGQPVKAEGFLDVGFHPFAQLRCTPCQRCNHWPRWRRASDSSCRS